MSTLRTTTLKHGGSTILDNLVLSNAGETRFCPNSSFGRAALYVDGQTNRVGVNTESPGVALDVDGAINATGNTTLGGTLTVTGTVVFNGPTSRFSNTLIVGPWDSSSDTAQGVAIDRNGTVFSQRPTSQSTLAVFSGYLGSNEKARINANGTARFKTPTGNGVQVTTEGGNEGTKFNFVGKNTSGTSTFTVNGDGNIAVGTDTVGFGQITNGIHVRGANRPGIRVQSDNGSGGIIEIFGENGGGTLDTRGSGFLRFVNASTEFGRFNSSGNFGLGTTNPVVPFVISDDGDENLEMGYSSSDSNHYVQAYNRSSSQYTNLNVRGTLVTVTAPSVTVARFESQKQQIGWCTFAESGPTSVAPATNQLVNINGVAGDIIQVQVYIRVYFATNGSLSSLFDYGVLTCDTTGGGGGDTIRQTLNDSAGAFTAVASDFTVSRSASGGAGTITITYLNTGGGTNFVKYWVQGKFKDLS